MTYSTPSPRSADADTSLSGNNPVETLTTARPAGRRAAHRATQEGCLYVTLPGLGQISLGPPEQLAYFAGITALVAFELIEWPVAVVIAAGHVLADQRRSKTLHALGEALEEA